MQEFTARKCSLVLMSSWDLPKLLLCCSQLFFWTGLVGGLFCCWAQLEWRCRCRLTSSSVISFSNQLDYRGESFLNLKAPILTL